MKINKITNQIRRDFWADLICEHCGNIEYHVSGYDDEFFHDTVIPNMKCNKCGNKAPDDYRPLKTKYKENEII